MSFSQSFDDLVSALTCLPGVGAKSAQRIALELLLKRQEQAKILARAIDCAIENVRRCAQCRNLSDTEICLICSNPKRNTQHLCVVENPADVLAIEQNTDYQGLYFVLMGHIAPLDGVGAQELGLDILDKRLASGEITELLIATNSTLEGEATAYFLGELAQKHAVSATRPANGVPMGGELSYLDRNTLSFAFRSRQTFSVNS